MTSHSGLRAILSTAALTLLLFAQPSAQEGKSAVLAKQLVDAMQQGNLQYLAAKIPKSERGFVAVLALPGTLLVVGAEYLAPQLLEDRLKEKGFQEVYQELQSASVRETKTFVSDLGADGLRSRPGDGQPYDTYTTDAGRVSFNGDFRTQKLSEEDYGKRFAEADQKYAEMLTTLLAAAKPPS
jgi:hypothetical protein